MKNKDNPTLQYICCPFCRRKMKSHESPSAGRIWDCENCEVLFRITQMAFYPIKGEGEA